MAVLQAFVSDCPVYMPSKLGYVCRCSMPSKAHWTLLNCGSMGA